MLPLLLLAVSSCFLLAAHKALLQRLHRLLAIRSCQLPDGRKADVALVLGYLLTKSGQAMQPLQDRVRTCVQLLQQERVNTVILSGAHPGDGLRVRSEARAMAGLASELLGVSKDSIGPPRWHLEELSTSTRENMMFSLPIAQEQRWSTILLVTSQFHQLRSLLAYRRAVRDLKLQPVPEIFVASVPFTARKGPVGFALDIYDWGRELAALAWYKWKGYI